MRNLHIFSMLFCMILLSACRKEIENGSPADGSDRSQVGFSLTISSELHDNLQQTRAAGFSEPLNEVKNFNDKDVRDLWVVQTMGGKVVVSKYFTDIQSNVSSDQSAKIVSELMVGDSEIWFIANTGNDKLFLKVSTLNDLKAKTLDVKASDPEGSLAVDGYLRAVGCWKGTITESSNYISASLAPLAAKLTVDYEITGAGDGMGFEEIQLMNVPMNIRYCTTDETNATTDFSTTNYSGFKPDGDTKRKGRLIYYVTENIPGIAGVVNDDPRNKSKYGTGTGAMYLFFQGRSEFKGVSYPFSGNIFPGGNATNDFNVRINHDYHITLRIDVGNGPDNWKEDTRITTDIKLPTDGLEVRYEFSNDNRKELNSLYDADGTTLLPADGKYLRNLAKENSYSTERLTYSDAATTGNYAVQTFEDGTDYMSYSNCSIDTGYGEELTTSSSFTIIYIGGSSEKNGNGWSVYGPTNYGDRKNDPIGEKDGRRWYLVVNHSGLFQYGSHCTMNKTIPDFTYEFKDDPYIIFSADKNTPKEGTDNGGMRDIILNNATAQVVDVPHYKFNSNFYLGCNKWEYSWVTKKGRVYLFLIYNKTLTTEEINQVRLYALYKGYLKNQLPENTTTSLIR